MAAKVRTGKAPAFLDRLKTALLEELRVAGIKAEVEAEPVPTTKLYRMWVLAPKFRKLQHWERQNLVWRIAESALSRAEQMRISMIVTLTPLEKKET